MSCPNCQLKEIMVKFANSGWDLISGPAQDWLDGKNNSLILIKAIKTAQAECGTCGCEFDFLYQTALDLLT